MKKLKLNIVLALMCFTAGIYGYSLDAKAGTESLEWTVQYDGGKNFETLGKDAANSTIANAMPGDTLQYVVSYKNKSEDKKTYDFYLDADVLSSLEDNAKAGDDKASGGGYSYKVEYEFKGEKVTVYDSDTVGGSSTVTEGLNQVKSNDAYVSVGRLAYDESGKVIVTIVLDGNSQDNSYMAKFAELSIGFGVQDAVEGDGRHDVITNTITKSRHNVYKIPGGTEIVYIDDVVTPLAGPRTGDSILPIVFCGIAFIIGIMFILWYFKLTKDEKKEVA